MIAYGATFILTAVDVRLRHKKTNFSALAEPFDVSLSFSDESIVATTRVLTPADLAQETTLNAGDRVLAALAGGPKYPYEIAETTGLALGTVKNKLTDLRKANEVENTGVVDGQTHQVRLVEARERTHGTVSSLSLPLNDSDSDDTTVAGLFANPPDWLTRQLAAYHDDPANRLRPLCAAVADVVLSNAAHWAKVEAEVRKALGEDDDVMVF